MAEQVLEGAVPAFPVTAAPTGEAMRLQPRMGWRALQLAVDFGIIVLAGLSTYAAYLMSGLGQHHVAPTYYLNLIVIFAGVTIFALQGHGAYRSQMGLLRIESVRCILRAVFSSVLLLTGLSFLLELPSFSRLTLLMLGPFTVVALTIGRLFLGRVRAELRTLSGRATRVLVYGCGDTGRLLAQRLLEDHSLGLNPVGFLDDNAETWGRTIKVGPGVGGQNLQVLGGQDDLDAVMQRTRASVVFLAMPAASTQRIADLVGLLEGRDTPFFFVPSAGELMFAGLRFGQVAGIPVFSPRRPGSSVLYDLARRLLDVAGSLILLGLTLPVLAVAALLIRLSTGGSVLFSQKRIGLNGCPFSIYKLRTMRVDAPPDALHPRGADDPRITRVGRLLRRLSIDELPQLWNVLRGEMSLVGPRPEMAFVVAEYDAIQRQRLAVKPGLTGLWQISADRAFRIHDNVHYDLYYVENRSLSLDLAILLMTPVVLLARDRAV
jgi:exopolysaccharide biosynthesis polyprenyl glycosylphosphotransferase